MVTWLLNRAFFTLLLIAGASPAMAQQWTALGPDGGDVRSLARDPHSANRLFLGTSAGQVYESLNGGKSWSRFVKLGGGRDLVLDHIVFHPTRSGVIYVAAWSVEENTGDIFRSVDDGKTWKPLREMRGKSVRAFNLAESTPEVLVAGALDGVYRSLDGGDHWSLISPANHPDLRNFESIAIDPRNPDIIYAGTWHLPWKTVDGGLTWANIKQGLIDDSDVFSIIVDPANPSVVYASACSGIYKSETAGTNFRKIQGIPFSARRTRVLKQDPTNAAVVYAGTTEGLWKTIDSGTTWKRISDANLIINDILIDPAASQNVILATDRSGVLASSHGGEALVPSNNGFAHRQVATVLVDQQDSATVYAGVINDKEFGGVFVSRNGGSAWSQISRGLNGSDVFSLQQTTKGTLVAGTNRGVFTVEPSSPAPLWTLRDKVINVVVTSVKAPGAKGKRQTVRKVTNSQLSARVTDLHIAAETWYAATSSGIFASNDEGRSWHGGPVGTSVDFISVQSTKDIAVAATRKSVVVSLDGGQTWKPTPLPTEVSLVSNVTVDPSARIFLAAREGAYRSSDSGLSWERLTRLPVNQLSSIYYDEEGHRLLTSSTTSTHIFQSTDSGNTWKRSDAGWILRGLRSSRGRVYATTVFDGIVSQSDASFETIKAVAASVGVGGAQD